MKLSDGTINVDRLEHGGWVDDIPGMPGFRVKTRGVNNADYRRRQMQEIEALPRKKRTGRTDPDDTDRIVGICLLETCLLDWDGLEENGEAVPYSKDLAKQLIFEPKYRMFRDAFLNAAVIVSEQIETDEKETAANL